MSVTTEIYQRSAVPGQQIWTGVGELVVSTTDYDSGQLTIATGLNTIFYAHASFVENQGLDLPPIWADLSTAGTVVFKCANADQLTIRFIIIGI